MSYGVDLRERIVGYARSCGSPAQAPRLFQRGRTALVAALVRRTCDQVGQRSVSASWMRSRLPQMHEIFRTRCYGSENRHFGIATNAIRDAAKKRTPQKDDQLF